MGGPDPIGTGCIAQGKISLMFTGLIEEIGNITAVTPNASGKQFRIAAQKVLSDLKHGDSIAIDGVCLTAIAIDRAGFSAQAVHETLYRSTLGDIRRGAQVNLERAVQASSRFGGHIVQGHVDGVGEIVAIDREGQGAVFRVRVPSELNRYMVEKGSVAIQGISLTIADIRESLISISVIPVTLQETNLHTRKVGDTVNLEVDILAKYAERMMRNESEVPLSQRMKNWGYTK